MSYVKSKAILAVAGSGIFLLYFNWLLEGSQLGKYQSTLLHWNYAHHFVLILIPLFFLGFDSKRKRCYAVLPTGSLQIVRYSFLISLPLITFPFVGHLLTAPFVLSNTAANHPISTAVFQFFFVAVGEEIFFRGFWQGELNRAFGRPWSIGQTRFGWGVVAVALLFGVGHLLNPFNPLQGSYTLNWQGLLYTGGFALVVGLLRERFNSLIPGIIFHASWMVYLTWILPVQSGTIGFNIAIGVAFSLSFYFIIQGPKSTNIASNPLHTE